MTGSRLARWSGRCLAAGAVTVAAACGTTADASFVVEVVVEGLDRPTQLAVADEAWFVAHLNGGEAAATGQVLRLDPTDPAAAPVVVVDGLRKPTGVAVFAGELWIMEERRLTRGPLDGGSRTVVVDEMAFNGRSQGTLTVDGDRLLFDTSGTTGTPPGPGGGPRDRSGVLWAVDAMGTVTNVAWGFKHAYAHVRDDAGVLWSTEVSDGRYDGVPAVDEVVAVEHGVGHGWPVCVDDGRPVLEAAVDAPCDGVPGSQVTFGAGATPTGIAVAPWDRTRLVVALWVPGRVVSFSNDPEAAGGPVTLVTEVLARPQHLVVAGERLLVTDHEAGTISEIRPR